MNADAGSLPDMLRQPDGVVFVKDVNMSGVTGPNIGPELASLVEAEDAGDVEAYKAARAALVAKIGGSK